MILTFWAAATSFTISFLAVPVLRPVLRRYAVVDMPNERSSHTQETVRGGGIAPLLGVTTGGGLLLSVGISDIVVVSIVAGAVSAGVLGLIEDVRGLSVPLRALGQLGVGVFVAVCLGTHTGQQWWAVGLMAIAIMAYINIANFMDGINGISGMHGALVGIVYALIGYFAALPWAMPLGLVLAGAFAAFLPWNLRKPGIFLGDVGSYLLGAATASLGLALAWAGVSPIVVLAPLVVYLADSLTTLVRRAARSEPILRPHRTHVYQRLTETGLGHQGASAIVTLFAVATSAVGILSQLAILSSLSASLLILALCLFYLALPRLRGSRLAPRASMALAPINVPVASSVPVGFIPKKWVVVGASGFVGSALVAHVRGQGFEVKGVVAPRLGLSPECRSAEDVSSRAADIEFISQLISELAGADVVVNAAGLATPDAPPSDDLYGANALLPALVLQASARAGVKRVIHLSSAAVQGHRAVLDERVDVWPFSPYSHSKALGERAFFVSAASHNRTSAVVIRATSVQGSGRRTTASLKKIARSPLASVAGDGSHPTVVSSIDGLVDFITRVARAKTPVGPIMLQPWEGFTVEEVLRIAGGKNPTHLPSWVCRIVLLVVKVVGKVVPEVAGVGRRIEMMWLGQQELSTYADDYPSVPKSNLSRILTRGEGGE